ncbi:MAG: UDP-2,3-diacylglucosamine diphosphatase [Tannerella sp.]|jgi:UDP-2,3-diacylglucosamine hydrolase|nr:UDP-2,3-diacylglucosamine diphosphatase [Tannerella sp.]
MNTPPRKIYFVSDIHLGNRYMPDAAEAEKKLVRWLDGIKNDAAAVYFLGDVFDYWYEYKYVVPRGYVRFLGKLAELSDLGIEIHLLTGNHDIWMFDYLPAETGAVIHRKPFTVELSGKKFFLAHGDEVGYRPPLYRIIQRIFRNRICQLLYATIHPRWTFGFARCWSLSSRRNGLAAKEHQSGRAKHLEAFAESYLQTHPDIDFFLFGHLHVLLDKKLPPSETRLLITGDWMQHFSYVEWDGDKLELKKFL